VDHLLQNYEEGKYPPFLTGLETQSISSQYKFNGSCRSCFAEWMPKGNWLKANKKRTS